MQKLIFFLTLFAVSQTQGQITTTAVKKPQTDMVNPKPAKYDSLRNYVGNNVYQYIGQEFYLRPKAEMLRQYGYEDFYISTDDEHKLNGENIYKCCESFNSIYDELAGKYFEVLEVIKHPKADEDNLLYGSKYFIKLREKQSGDIFFYRYDSKSIEEVFPFTIVGYFTKAKKRYIGKKYLTKGKNWIGEGPMTDIETGKVVSIAQGKVWKCIDVTIEDKYFEVSLVLQSATGEKVAIGINSLKSDHFASEKF